MKYDITLNDHQIEIIKQALKRDSYPSDPEETKMLVTMLLDLKPDIINDLT